MYVSLPSVDDTTKYAPRQLRKAEALGYATVSPQQVTGTWTSSTAAIAIENSSALWFSAWSSEWVRDTAHLSSLSSRQQHRAYKNIVGLGSIAVPMLLGELRAHPDFWFSALREITGEDPVKDHMRGNFAEMRDAWINWAREKRLMPVDVRKVVPKNYARNMKNIVPLDVPKYFSEYCAA